MTSNNYQEVIVVNSFNSVFLDSINNEHIEYDSSEMESVRFTSCEEKSEKKLTTIHLNTNTNKHSFSFFNFFCYCFLQH